jgi:hypothetical protein
VSASSIPTSTAGRHTGSERNRSKIPLEMSVRRAMPVYIVIIVTVCTSTPGMRNWRYCEGEPASAPPNR